MSNSQPQKKYNTRSKTKETTERKEDKKEEKQEKKNVVISLDSILNALFMNKKREKTYNDEDDDNNDEEEDTDDEDYDEEDDEIIQKINALNIDDETKEMLKEKYLDSDDFDKSMNWINTVLKIPFGKFANMPMTIDNKADEIVEYFEKSRDTMDKVVHGMDNVKEELLAYIAQIITSKQQCCPRVLALQGPPGVAKTRIIRKGFADVLCRPIQHISMGGISDSSTFFGFDYTYTGSRCGVIIDAIIKSGVMNPIIFLDELDKISETAQGADIANFLVHLTDPEQNMTFRDKYIGFDIDMSKVMFVFSFNQDNLINPILLDRLNVIRIKSPSLEEKRVIALKYMLPEACQNIGFNNDDIQIDDNAVSYLLRMSSTNEGGMRDIKRAIETLIMRLNTIKLTGNKLKLSYSIKPDIIETNNYIMVPVSKKKKLKMLKPEQKMLFKITDQNIKKLISKEEKDASYSMMFL